MTLVKPVYLSPYMLHFTATGHIIWEGQYGAAVFNVIAHVSKLQLTDN